MHSGYLRTKWASPRRIRFWLLVLLSLYTLLGFFAVPWAVHYVATNTAEQDFDRELQIEAVRANPFTLTLRVDGLVLNDIDEQELISLDRLSVNFAWASIINRAWTFNSIRLDEPTIHEERFESGETRFTRLAAAATDTSGEESDDGSAPPALRVNNLHVEGGELRFKDNFDIEADSTEKESNETNGDTDTPQQVSLALENIRLTLENFTLHDDTRAALRVEGQLADGGMLDFNGTLQMVPDPTLEGDLSIDELALAQGAPYLQYFAGVRLDSGALSLNGQLHTGAEQPFAFEGSAGIRELRISQGEDDETLIGWESLQTEQIDLNIRESELETGVIAVNELSGQIIINEDKTTNFGNLGKTPPADPEASAEAKDEESEAEPFSITIEGIELTDGAIHFADNSLPLPFSTNIQSLNGNVSTISSTSSEPARIELEGQVEDYGLARAEGSFHAWQPTRQTTVTVTFRNLEIPEYSPYTVDFAGRAIAGGTMDLDLEYTIDNEQLDGENKLVLRNLELGEQIESSDAMDLPLNLAIALLEDSEGVIDITLPVTGDVSDPEFDFNAVIREAIGQAITSVLEAPFSFLANLIGADSEDLGQIGFAEGSSELSPPQRQRITELREALNQRPALTLELAGPFSRNFDGQAIKREKAIDALRQRLVDADRDVEDPSLTSEDNQDIVEAMFSSSYPDSDLEAVRSRFTEEQNGSSDETEFDALAYRNYLAEQVIAVQSVSDEELQAIGNARAASIRDALVNSDEDSDFAADRVRIMEPEAIDSVDDELIALEVGITTN
ncbi:hypothetical protein CWE12_02410 [Aliidiomarina sedimenti]|uniref:DUF748 domain-containing protein n=1 Tax=Aliidiomarina sedimenti TaxID=1933879 RepID=A0ABY0C2A4_9GAMM|nr:DUF748 domain-containing protein [Aliidiomarina sedimenti]RUO31869.1 hypothetical protein CWE12_02410 [Aliidiomarina sedimenti]